MHASFLYGLFLVQWSHPMFFLISRILLFLVPPPFVHLRLRESSYLGHFCDILLPPIGHDLQFFFQNFDLGCALPLPFPHPILVFFILIILHHFWLLLGRAVFGIQFIFNFITVFLRNFIALEVLFVAHFALALEKLRKEVRIHRDGGVQHFQLGFAASWGPDCEESGRKFLQKVLIVKGKFVKGFFLGSERMQGFLHVATLLFLNYYINEYIKRPFSI